MGDIESKETTNVPAIILDAPKDEKREFKTVEVEEVDENDASLPFNVEDFIAKKETSDKYVDGQTSFDGSEILDKLNKHIHSERISIPVINKVCEYQARGFSLGSSCRLANVTYRTFFNWVKRGKQEAAAKNKRQKNALYLYAYQGIKAAEEQFKEWHLKIIDREAAIGENKGSKSSQWRLSRRFPKEFGEKMQVQMEANKKLLEVANMLRGIDTKVKDEIEARPIKDIEQEEKDKEEFEKSPYRFTWKKDEPEEDDNTDEVEEFPEPKDRYATD